MTGPLVNLDGRHAAVTGAASGLGRAIARTLAGAGARVSVLDINAAGADQTVAQIREAGGSADAIRCDVADAGSIAAAFDQVTASGPADILVNNAGINPRQAIRFCNPPFQTFPSGPGWLSSAMAPGGKPLYTSW